MKLALKSIEITAIIYLTALKNKGLEGLKMRGMYTVFLIPHPAGLSYNDKL
jgi:hypothetical protein